MSDTDEAMHSMSSDQLNNCMEHCILDPDEEAISDNELEGVTVAPPLSASCPMFREDVSLSDFYVLGRIGVGSCSTVVLAENKECGNQFAIKVINKRHVVQHNMADYIRTEHDILQTLSDDGVCKMHFAFEDEVSLYIGLEHCSGGELYTQIRKAGSLPLVTARFYAAEIVLMLETLRSHGIIHRDLKPENLLLTEMGHLKLIDFGSAKVVKLVPVPSCKDAAVPRTTSLVGTAEYVAPEVLLNEGVSFASDLWALGCIIYKMLTGRTPFKGTNQHATFKRIVAGAVDFPADFSVAARNVVERLLDVKPNCRLGALDLEDLKSHEFFDGIEWDMLRSRAPPEPLSPTTSGADSEVTTWPTTSVASFADTEAQLIDLIS